jgi:hypothetical protein
VTYVPGDPTSAFATAQTFAKVNGFTNGVSATNVTAGLAGKPTRLQVTVSQTVANFFGSLLGRPSTAVTKRPEDFWPFGLPHMRGAAWLQRFRLEPPIETT